MTNTTTKTEWTVDRPDALADLEDAIEKHKGQLDRLGELSDDLDSTRRKAKNLNSDSREIVADSMSDIRCAITRVDLTSCPPSDTITRLEELQQRIDDEVADPYRQAVSRARKNLGETLGALADIDEETMDQLDERLENRSVDELQNDRDAFEQATDELELVSDAAQAAVAKAVTDAPDVVLGDPTNKLVPVVEDCVDRHQKLQSIDEALDDVDWAPGVTLARTAQLYEPEELVENVTTVTEHVEDIDSVVANVDDELPLTRVLHIHLTQTLSAEDPKPLEELFLAASQGVTECANHEEIFGQASDLVEAVETVSREPLASVERHLETVQPTDEEDGGVSSLEELEEELRSLDSAYGQWVEQYTRTLRKDAVAIDVIQTKIDWAPEFDCPDGGIAIPGTDVDSQTITDDPAAAVRTHDAYRDWVDDLQTRTPVGATEDGSGMVDSLLDLVRGRQVPAEEVDKDAFAELATLFETELTLQLLEVGTEEKNR